MAASDGASSSGWELTLLERRHRRSEFSCGVDDLDNYIQRFARQNDRKDIGRTYILSPTDDVDRVAGYFTVSVGSVSCDEAPEPLTKGLPRYPIPVVLLARLAIDEEFQGCGLGELLLMEALEKASTVSEIAGARAVQVDAISDDAVRFYQRYGFVQMPGQPRVLFLSMTTVRKALSGAG